MAHADVRRGQGSITRYSAVLTRTGESSDGIIYRQLLSPQEPRAMVGVLLSAQKAGELGYPEALRVTVEAIQ